MTQSPTHHRIEIEVQLDPHRSARDLEELRHGLEGHPRRIPSKYFYDKRGSILFEEITRLPEYYPTRAERDLLRQVADQIARETRAEELVELGAGAAVKTRILLDAMRRSGRLRLYVPFDVSETEVRRVAADLASEYPDLWVHGIVADFVHHLAAIPPGSPRLVILLGSTIGNYTDPEAVRLLENLGGRMAPGDFFLLGADLIKDVQIIERAYNDSAGITARFNRNILLVVNRLTGGNFDPEAFEHSATYNAELHRIEMHLIARRPQRVELPALNMGVNLEDGAHILTEISRKYDRDRIETMLAAAGFQLIRWSTGRDQLFALALARKR